MLVSAERPNLLQRPETARPRISTKKTRRKFLPGPEFCNPRKIPSNYPQNTGNRPKWLSRCFGILLVFPRYFGSVLWGSRTSGRGDFFSLIFVESLGLAISDLCSRPGRSQAHVSRTSQGADQSTGVNGVELELPEPCGSRAVEVNDMTYVNVMVSSSLWRRAKHDLGRAARLQNETAPTKLSTRCQKWFEQRGQGSEKRSETCPKTLMKPLLLPLKLFSPALFQRFSPP